MNIFDSFRSAPKETPNEVKAAEKRCKELLKRADELKTLMDERQFYTEALRMDWVQLGYHPSTNSAYYVFPITRMIDMRKVPQMRTWLEQRLAAVEEALLDA